MNAALAEMFRYNGWANATLLDACCALTDEQLDARVAGVSGSVRELLLHMVGGQQTFALRTRGRQHEGEWNRGSAWPGFTALIAAAQSSSAELLAIASALDADSEVGLPWQGRRYAFPVSFFLTHAFAHGVEHRTEIKLALAQQGVATPDLDAWQYNGVRGYGREL